MWSRDSPAMPVYTNWTEKLLNEYSIKFLNEDKFLNEYNIFEWNLSIWMKMKFLNEIIEIDKTAQNWRKI